MKRVALLLLLLPLLSLSFPTYARQAGKKPAPAASRIPALLERAGYKYSKIGENVWEIPFTGKNIKEFSVRITSAGGDLILVLTKLADRGDVNLNNGIAVKLLELNDAMDTVKFALSSDMLYARLELHERLVDAQEFKYMLEQISGAVDEAYPQVKPLLVK